MIPSWGTYIVLVGLLLAAAASLAEGPLHGRRLPVRWLWVACLAAVFLVPATAFLTRPAPPTVPLYRFVAADELAAELSAPAHPPVRELPDQPARYVILETDGRIDVSRWLLIGWAVTSCVLALLLVASATTLRRRRRLWRPLEVDGRRAWISPDTGPAVVGAFPGTLVLPDWLLRLPPEDRELILKHEEEHVRARDPLLLLTVLLLRIALPWHPALWWIGRSLRRAVELDCDRRVLSRGADPRAYARILLDVSERGSAHRLSVALLPESPSFLERRIRLMITKPLGLRGPRAAGAVVLAIVTAAAACQIDQPESQPIVATGFTMAPAEAEVPTMSADDATQTAQPARPLPALSRAELGDSIKAAFRSIVRTRHPEVVTGAVRGERVNLYVAIDGNGDVIASRVDTEPRGGSCSTILEEGLGVQLDRESRASGGCGGLEPGEAGPSRVSYFWSTAKPANEQERLAPTGPYLFDRLLQASRPTKEQLAAAVRQYFPEVYEAGLPQGEGLWFAADRYHQVVHAGRGWEPVSSPAAREAIEQAVPGIVIDGVLMTGIRSANDTPIGISWGSLGTGSSSARAAGPDPYPQAQGFAISTAEPGRDVEIRLQGEAASDPSAVRISGKFGNAGGVLTAVTPFTLIVMTAAPYGATLRLQGSGEMRIETELQQRRLRTSGREIQIMRTTEGEAPSLLSADAIVGPRPVAQGLPAAEPLRR